MKACAAAELTISQLPVGDVAQKDRNDGQPIANRITEHQDCHFTANILRIKRIPVHQDDSCITQCQSVIDQGVEYVPTAKVQPIPPNVKTQPFQSGLQLYKKR